MPKNKKYRNEIVYSTNPKFEFINEEKKETLKPKEQHLSIYLEKKNRNGKLVTLIKGFIGKESDLKILAKLLKNKCGVGGSVKNDEIIIQGNVREKLIEILRNEGYNYKKMGK